MYKLSKTLMLMLNDMRIQELGSCMASKHVLLVVLLRHGEGPRGFHLELLMLGDGRT